MEKLFALIYLEGRRNGKLIALKYLEWRKKYFQSNFIMLQRNIKAAITLQRNIKAAIDCSNTFGMEEKIGNLIAETFGTEEVLETQFHHAKKKKML